MFTYYLKSLHSYHELQLDVGKATTKAILDLLASTVEGHYVINRAMLHQGVHTLGVGKHDTESIWSIRFDDAVHQEQFQSWFQTHVEKTNHLHQLYLDSLVKNARGLNDLGLELVSKLKRDLPDECDANLDSVKVALISANEFDQSLTDAAKMSVLALSSPMSVVAHPEPTKKSVKRTVKKVS
jgi:hypothetical protein